jgi:hypothetical protein
MNKKNKNKISQKILKKKKKLDGGSNVVSIDPSHTTVWSTIFFEQIKWMPSREGGIKPFQEFLQIYRHRAICLVSLIADNFL